MSNAEARQMYEFLWLWTYGKQTFSVVLRCETCGQDVIYERLGRGKILIEEHVCRPSLWRRLRRWLDRTRAG